MGTGTRWSWVRPTVAAGGVVSLFAVASLAVLLRWAWGVGGDLSVLVVAPAVSVAVALLGLGLWTARGTAIPESAAARWFGWVLLGSSIFLVNGLWLAFLRASTAYVVPFLAPLATAIVTLGAFVGAVLGHYDVRQRVQRQRLRERERRLDERNDRLEEFASVVSHDLRNPLTVAKGHLELSRSDHDDDHLATVDRSLERMERLIDDLLTLARQGTQSMAPEPTRLDAVAHRAWQSVAAESATLDVDADRRLRADADRLQELLENLFRNSIEHASPEVTVRVDATEAGFAVEDDGPGIPAEDRESVFEAGYSTDPDGTGFGLRIVQRIAEGHGWSVSVGEGADGGARFTIEGVEWVQTDEGGPTTERAEADHRANPAPDGGTKN